MNRAMTSERYCIEELQRETGDDEFTCDLRDVTSCVAILQAHMRRIVELAAALRAHLHHLSPEDARRIFDAADYDVGRKHLRLRNFAQGEVLPMKKEQERVFETLLMTYANARSLLEHSVAYFAGEPSERAIPASTSDDEPRILKLPWAA